MQPFEKEEGNDFVVDVTLQTDMTKSAQSDDLKDALNYTKVHECTAEIMEGPSVDLIETLCYRIGSKLEAAFPMAREIEVAVRKLNPPIKAPISYTEARMSWPR